MQNFVSKIRDLEVKAYLKSMDFGRKIKNKIKNEDGDTNFISIIIILSIILVVASVFMIFKDNILGIFKTKYNDFSSQFNGQKPANDII